MSERAIIVRRPGEIGWERQVASCLRYIARQSYRLQSVTLTEADAVSLVRMHFASVVIAAVGGPDDDRFRMLVEDAGGRFEYCRRLASRLDFGDTGELVIRMFRRGGTPEQIAQLLGVALTSVRAIIRRRSSP